MEIDDTPYVVTSVHADGSGQPVDRAQRRHDGAARSRRRSRSATATSSTARSSSGAERARFLRPAYYQLADFIEETGARPLPAALWPHHTYHHPTLSRRRPLHVVLVAPEIPPNTGSIARLCAATYTRLHSIRPLGFSLDDRYLKRAGLDYWPWVDLHVYDDWEQFRRQHRGACMHFFSARADAQLLTATYAAGDYLVFGSETKGLPKPLLAAHRDDDLRHPDRQPARAQLESVQRGVDRRVRGRRQLRAGLMRPTTDSPDPRHSPALHHRPGERDVRGAGAGGLRPSVRLHPRLSPGVRAARQDAGDGA